MNNLYAFPNTIMNAFQSTSPPSASPPAEPATPHKTSQTPRVLASPETIDSLRRRYGKMSLANQPGPSTGTPSRGVVRASEPPSSSPTRTRQPRALSQPPKTPHTPSASGSSSPWWALSTPLEPPVSPTSDATSSDGVSTARIPASPETLPNVLRNHGRKRLQSGGASTSTSRVVGTSPNAVADPSRARTPHRGPTRPKVEVKEEVQEEEDEEEDEDPAQPALSSGQPLILYGKFNPGPTRKELASDQPFGFSRGINLMPHQIQSRRWMFDRERSSLKGGLLNDDMGLGKTIQAICRMNDSKILQGEMGITLIVCPKALFDQWEEEIKKFAPRLRARRHHGSDRPLDASAFDEYDVVITNYHTLWQEHHNYCAKVGKAIKTTSKEGPRWAIPLAKSRWTTLFEIKFLRLLLDEVHEIRNTDTYKAQAVFDILATYKWGLSGTFIQNYVHDLYALFKLLDAKPYSDRAVFDEAAEGGQLALIVQALQKLALRRTKKEILDMEDANIQTIDIHLSEHERELYGALQARLTAVMNKFSHGKDFKDFSCMYTWLLRLRQLVCHPGLCLESKNKEDHEDEDEETAKELRSKCTICLSKKDSKSTSRFCDDCRRGFVKKAGDQLYSRDLPEPESSKMRALRKILDGVHQASDGKDKIVVFSQWTGFLDRIERYLRDTNYGVIKYDGRMKDEARRAALEKYNSDPKVTVGLFSIKAGGVGLNLNIANHVVLMDPMYNPAVEDQAFDRVHRIGQKKPVTVYKLMVPMSVEDGMLEIQMKKRQLAKEVFEGVAFASKHVVTFDQLARVLRNNSIGWPGRSRER